MFEAIFRLMNNGEPVTRDILYRLLLKMYPGQTDVRKCDFIFRIQLSIFSYRIINIFT